MRPTPTGALLLLVALACGGSSPSSGTTPTQPTTAVVANVVLTGGVPLLEAGKSVQLNAFARDASGLSLDGKTFAWTTSNGSVATVSSTGLVTGVSAGSVTISASVDGKTGTYAMTIAAANPVVSTVTISGAVALVTGNTTVLTAVAKDASGVVVPATITWSSSDPTLISVSDQGVVTALRIGDATITATAGGKSATSPMRSILSVFSFNFESGVSAADQQLIKDAMQYAYEFSAQVLTFRIGTSSVAAVTSGAACDPQLPTAAITVKGAITICVSKAQWTSLGPIMRQRLAMREAMSQWQFTLNWVDDNQSATWLTNGAPDYLANAVLDFKGIFPITLSRGCNLKLLADAQQAGAAIPSLANLEQQAGYRASTIAQLYSAVAVDYLLSSTAAGNRAMGLYGITAINGWAVTPWTAAFQGSYGRTPTNFYLQFAGYLGATNAPSTYQCNV